MKKEKSKSTFQKELIILCVLTCVVAMLLQGAILTGVFVKTFSKNARKDIEFCIDKVNEEFNNKLQFLEENITFIRNDYFMNKFFIDQEYDKIEIDKRIDYCSNLFSDRNMVSDRYPFITQIFLFNKSGDCTSSVFYPTTVGNLKLETDYYREIQENFSKQSLEYYFQIGDDSIHLIFRIYDKYLQESGNCVVELNSEAIKEIFKEIEKYNDSEWLVAGNDDMLIKDSYKKTNARIEIEIDLEQNEKNWKDKYFFSVKQNSFGLNSVVTVSKSNIYDYLKSSLILMGAIIIVLLLCIAIIVFFVAYRFTTPLKIVAEKIKDFGKGNFDTKIEEFNTQELEDIRLVFNEMTNKINYLIKQVYENELLTTKAQIQYLQSQINPHFMFNILSMIGIKATMSGNDDVQKMIYAFSKLIQGKIFRKGEITIQLYEEMELVEFYLFLQSNRFEDKISYNITYEEESLKNVLIPRLCIEPIVENAVLHGLEPKDEEGTIDIIIGKKDNNLYIEVKDDGVGFDQARIVTTENKDHTHVGIFNTQRLIHNLYGEEFGIEITSKVGKGTSIVIKLPM